MISAMKCDLPVIVEGVSPEDTLSVFLSKFHQAAASSYGEWTTTLRDRGLTCGNCARIESDPQFRIALRAGVVFRI